MLKRVVGILRVSYGREKKGKTLTLAPASRSEPEHVILSPFAPKLIVPWPLKLEPIHETEIEPQHQA